MAKKEKQTEMPEVQRDDALFETLGKNKKERNAGFSLRWYPSY